MAKEVYIYGAFNSAQSLQFVSDLEQCKNEDIVLRINTPGGDVTDAWSCIAKFSEHAKGKKVKVDGKALSGGAFFLCAVEEAECLDVSQFLYHRAAFWFEQYDDLFTEDDKKYLLTVNAQLRKLIESKISADKFFAVTGVTYDQMFSLDARIDVRLTPDQALQLGLVQKINKATPAMASSINAMVDKYAAAAHSADNDLRIQVTEPKPNHQSNNDTMTPAEIKAKHPEAYAQIFNEGMTAERDRVGSYMAFAHLDIEGVKKGIAEGKAMTDTQRSEFALKVLSAEALKKLQADSAGKLTTAEQDVKEKTEEQKQFDAAKAEVDKLLGLDKTQK